MEYQIGQVIRGKRVNFNRGRVAAITLLSFAIALGFARVGTTVITTTHTPVANQCGTIKGSGGHPAGGGGGGTVLVGS